MKPSSTTKLVAALAATMVVTSACASDREGEAVVSAGSPTVAAQSAATSEATFGTLESPCGAGDASGATDQGVSDTEIRIGYGDDRGFAKSPGLNKEMGDAVAAMIDWCNEQGGINGRRIVGTHYDAAMTQANAVMQNACASEFMLVGHGFAMDQTSEQTRVACNLAAVPGIHRLARRGERPDDLPGRSVPRRLRERVAVVPDRGDVPRTRRTTSTWSTARCPRSSPRTPRPARSPQAAGFKLKDCGVTLNYDGESSYVPFAEKFKQCGAKGLWTSRSPVPAEFNFVKALDQVGIDPILLGEATWYANAVPAWNKDTGLLDNLHAGMTFQMLENADTVPAVKKYTELVAEAGGKTALLGMQATSSFLLWATAAKECGSDLTRQCMIDELSQIHEWDGGGLHAVTDPGNNMPGHVRTHRVAEGRRVLAGVPRGSRRVQVRRPSISSRPTSRTWGTELGAGSHLHEVPEPERHQAERLIRSTGAGGVNRDRRHPRAEVLPWIPS